MIKTALRKIFLDKRGSLSPGERAVKSKLIADRFFATVDLTVARYLHCFVSIEKFNEIDTVIIFHRLWKEHPNVQTVVPRLNSASGEIDNLVYTPDTELVPNAWGIPEPDHDDLVSAGDIDIVLVPLLCFDADGHRVGYGKGYYDKFLTRCREDCLKVGLSFFPAVDKIDDVNEHDVPLDLCVAPETLYKFGTSHSN